MHLVTNANPAGLPAGLQEKSPDYDSYCMLAEAYMTLQEPDKAAAAFEVRQHLVAPVVTCT
jgi:cytochrome c-type biogenesis protein CcmH/NrfG